MMSKLHAINIRDSESFLSSTDSLTDTLTHRLTHSHTHTLTRITSFFARFIWSWGQLACPWSLFLWHGRCIIVFWVIYWGYHRLWIHKMGWNTELRWGGWCGVGISHNRQRILGCLLFVARVWKMGIELLLRYFHRFQKQRSFSVILNPLCSATRLITFQATQQTNFLTYR